MCIALEKRPDFLNIKFMRHFGTVFSKLPSLLHVGEAAQSEQLAAIMHGTLVGLCIIFLGLSSPIQLEKILVNVMLCSTSIS